MLDYCGDLAAVGTVADVDVYKRQVYLVAETLNMRTVTWLLNSLLQVGLLTLVVLFQPEIRRALERMGQTDQWAAKLFNVKGRCV